MGKELEETSRQMSVLSFGAMGSELINSGFRRASLSPW
jgi:hypothetical protein